VAVELVDVLFDGAAGGVDPVAGVETRAAAVVDLVEGAETPKPRRPVVSITSE